MKDVKTELQTAYFTLLNGNIVIPKETWPDPIRPAMDYTVPVYDSVPSDATYPYIGFQEFTETDDSDKSSFGADETFTLEIVDRYENTWTKVPRNFVCNRVKEIVRARPVPISMSGLNVINSVVDSENTNTQATDTHTYLISIIRFRHLIEELNQTG